MSGFKFAKLCSCVGLVVALIAGSAQAENKDIKTERFRLSLDNNGILGTEWAAAPGHLTWGLNLWLTFSDDSLSLYSTQLNGDRERVGQFIDKRLGGSVSAWVSLFNRLQLGLELPVVVSQSRPTNQPRVSATPLDQLEDFGIGDLTGKAKIALKKDPRAFNAAFILTGTVRTANFEQYRGEKSFTIQPEVAVSKAFGKFRAAANLGYLYRPKTVTLLDLVVEDELFAHLGVGYRTGKLGLGLAGAVATRRPENGDTIFDRFNNNYTEAFWTVDYTFADKFTIFGMGGMSFTQGHGGPDWRMGGGVRYGLLGGADADGDGVYDNRDQCPNEPEDRDGFEDSNGCPDTDNDQDGVLDVNDAAPNDPEDKDNFEDEDGKPDLDNDADGIADLADKCPNEPENINSVEDEDGCPDNMDADGDGINDNEDRCPNDPEDVDNFEDTDGCPDTDNDQDGVTDAADGCPDKAGPPANQGCPDEDRDGDGVVDRLDNCPDEKGEAKYQGCKKKQLVRITDGSLEILDIVYFRTNRSRIRSRSYRLLRNVASVLKNQPRIQKVRVEGHTDSRGSTESNEKLSQARAEAVVDFLVKQGLTRSRLEAVGFGEANPVASNETRKGRAANRRVEFNIVDPPTNIKTRKSGPTSDTID